MSRPAFPNDLSVWLTSRTAVPDPEQPLTARDRPPGNSARRQVTKSVEAKYVGSTRPSDTLLILPGMTTRGLLKSLGLDPAGYRLFDARNATSYMPDEVIFARITDGSLVHIAPNGVAGA